MDLVSNSWRITRARLTETRPIRSFGPLAVFDYLERLSLAELISPPDEYLLSGGGPVRGIETIFGDSQNVIDSANILLQPLLTHDRRAVFALETLLCNMQKNKIRNSFVEYFDGHISLEQLIERYLASFPRRLYPQ